MFILLVIRKIKFKPKIFENTQIPPVQTNKFRACDLEIKETTKSSPSVTYSNCGLYVKLSTSFKVKRNDFSIPIHVLNFPFSNIDTPSGPADGIFCYGSQLCKSLLEIEK